MNNKKMENAFVKYDLIEADKCLKFKKLDDWLNKESSIFLDETMSFCEMYPNFKRGEILKVDFGVGIGSEWSHSHFAIVLNKDDTTKNDNITVVPLTSKNGYNRLYLGKLISELKLNEKYNKDSYVAISHITTISKRRILPMNKKYFCNGDILDKIDKEIIKSFTGKKIDK